MKWSYSGNSSSISISSASHCALLRHCVGSRWSGGLTVGGCKVAAAVGAPVDPARMLHTQTAVACQSNANFTCGGQSAPELSTMTTTATTPQYYSNIKHAPCARSHACLSPCSPLSLWPEAHTRDRGSGHGNNALTHRYIYIYT